MGFFWTKDGHKYKHTSGPSSLTDGDQTQEARGRRDAFVFTVKCRKYLQKIQQEKDHVLAIHWNFIQIVYRISSK